VGGGGRLKSLDSINANLPVQLSLVSYLRLSQSTVFWDRKTLDKDDGIGVSQTLEQFLSRFKKGSKPFRKILSSPQHVIASKVRTRVLNNFKRITGTIDNFDDKAENMFLSWWGNNFLKNRSREFIFKYSHNMLSVNSRLSHYGNNINESCTLCSMNGALPVPRETFLHLFLDCPVVEELHNKLSEDFWPGLMLDNLAVKKNLWLFGTGTGFNNLFVQVTIGTVQQYIWECKVKKHPISFNSAKTFVLEHLRDYVRISNKLRISSFDVDLPICRRARNN
jgi:hypothetical protein